MSQSLYWSLKDLHARISTLESVWDVQVGQAQARAIRHDVEVSLKATGRSQARNRLYQELRASKDRPVPGLLCETPDCPGGPVSSLQLGDVVHELDRTDGLEDDVIIFDCSLHSAHPAVVKFRRGSEGDPNTMTEKELRNSLAVAQSPAAAALFARVYFLLSLRLAGGWEGIGMQKLENFTPKERSGPGFYPQCFDLLCRLHDLGFVHGDSHTYNFMKDPATGQALFIDNDRCAPLAGLEEVQRKTMMCYDFVKLLMLNNVHMPFYQSIKGVPGRLEHVTAEVYKYMKDSDKISPEIKSKYRFFLWPAHMRRFDWAALSATFQRFPKFARMMRETPMQEIRASFRAVFDSKQEIRELDAFLKKISQDIRKSEDHMEDIVVLSDDDDDGGPAAQGRKRARPASSSSLDWNANHTLRPRCLRDTL